MWRQRLENVPLFLEGWMQHQRKDAYWRRGSVCEDYWAIQCPVFAVGGWTDGYTNTIPRLLEHLRTPSKGLIGPWAHGYPHIARPGPQIGFLQEILRWWDHWLKGEANGVMDEPMLRAWISENVSPAADHLELPGRWVAEDRWPPAESVSSDLLLSNDGLRAAAMPLTSRRPCAPQRRLGRMRASGARSAMAPTRLTTKPRTTIARLRSTHGRSPCHLTFLGRPS